MFCSAIRKERFLLPAGTGSEKGKVFQWREIHEAARRKPPPRRRTGSCGIYPWAAWGKWGKTCLPSSTTIRFSSWTAGSCSPTTRCSALTSSSPTSPILKREKRRSWASSSPTATKTISGGFPSSSRKSPLRSTGRSSPSAWWGTSSPSGPPPSPPTTGRCGRESGWRWAPSRYGSSPCAIPSPTVSPWPSRLPWGPWSTPETSSSTPPPSTAG